MIDSYASLESGGFLFFKLICCHYAVWHGFGKICGDEKGIDDGKYGMDEGQG